MDAPNTFPEVAEMPEVPEDYDGNIVAEMSYIPEQNEPGIPAKLFKLQVNGEDQAWFISKSSASKMHRLGYRKSCLKPVGDNLVFDSSKSIIYNFKSTMQYSDWYFKQKIKWTWFSNIMRRKFYPHFIMVFFCEDPFWEPYHDDYMINPDKNVESNRNGLVSIKNINITVTGREQHLTNSVSLTKYAIEFCRIFIFLQVVYNSDFNGSVLREKLELYGYKLNGLENIMPLYDFHGLSEEFEKYPILKSAIFNYFLERQDAVGDLTRIYVRDRPFNCSIFAIIVWFLAKSDFQTEAHFDETLVDEIKLFLNEYKKLKKLFKALICSAEDIIPNEIKHDQWKHLAAISLYRAMTDAELTDECEKLKNLLPDLIGKLKKEKEGDLYATIGQLREFRCSVCIKYKYAYSNIHVFLQSKYLQVEEMFSNKANNNNKSNIFGLKYVFPQKS